MRNKEIRRFTITAIALINICKTSFATTSSNKDNDIIFDFILSNAIIPHQYKIFMILVLLEILAFIFGYLTARMVDYIAYYKENKGDN
jgi:hypothetical protein